MTTNFSILIIYVCLLVKHKLWLKTNSHISTCGKMNYFTHGNLIARCHHHLYSLCVILLTIISSFSASSFLFIFIYFCSIYFCFAVFSVFYTIHIYITHIHTHTYFINQWVRLFVCVKACYYHFLSPLIYFLFCCQSAHSFRVSVWKKDIRVFDLKFFLLSFFFISIINIDQYYKIQFIKIFS